MMLAEYHDVIGLFGVSLILIAYLLLQLKKIRSSYLSYSILNIIGSLLVMVSLSQNFNLSSFVVESCWFVISFVGLFIDYRRRDEG